MKPLLAVFSLSLCMISACGAARTGDSQQLSAHQHYQRWSELPQNYTVTFQQQCFCMPDYLRPMRISVKDDRVIEALFTDDNSAVPQDVLNDVPTIEKVFSALNAASAIPAEKILVEFDSEFHFPKTIYIDYDGTLADEEIHWQLSDLHLTTQ